MAERRWILEGFDNTCLVQRKLWPHSQQLLDISAGLVHQTDMSGFSAECLRGVPRPASAARASGVRSMGVPLRPQFPNGIVRSVSFVSTTNTARSLAGFVSLALALTPWRSPGSSEKLCPAS